jgi:hypothetical protein
MHTSLQPCVRSRYLRVMSVLAWLMLALNPWSATMAYGAMAHAADGTHVSMSAHGMHSMMSDASVCCPHHADHRDAGTGHACHCATTCSNAMLPPPHLLAMTALVSTTYPVLSRITPPRLNANPPLRPPAA